jgi:hypothetical protein
MFSYTVITSCSHVMKIWLPVLFLASRVYFGLCVNSDYKDHKMKHNDLDI